MDIDLRSSSAPPTYSIVVPVHNEVDTLPELHRRLLPVLDRLDGPAEVLLVDDGSQDDSWSLIGEINRSDSRFKGIQLSRNFGHQAAITAGMDLAAGLAVVVMDADLQDPPEVILEMALRWRRGFEVVYGVREDRSTDTWFKRTTADLFYKCLNKLSDVEIPKHVGDFRLIDHRAVEAFRSMREGSRFVRGMYSWIGFRQIGVPYRRDARYAGETKYPVKKMIRLAADAVLGFSRVPLVLAMKLGALTATVSIMAAVLALVVKVSGWYAVPGWSSILLAVCLIGGIQLAFLGVIGQYVGRTYEESIGRPLYVVSHLNGARAPLVLPRRAVIAEPVSVATVFGTHPVDRESEVSLQNWPSKDIDGSPVAISNVHPGLDVGTQFHIRNTSIPIDD